MKTNKKNGFSLVEVLIGFTIIVVVLVATMLALRVFTVSQTSLQIRDYVDQSINSVYEQIRYDAALKFDTMAEDNVLRGEHSHTSIISIYSTIGPIDGKSRPVTLTAKWREAGVLRSKTVNFTVAYTKYKLNGGLVHFRIVNALNTSQGLTGVKITMSGQDNSEVFCESHEGDCTVGGVKIGDPVSTAAVSGEFAYVDPDEKGFFFTDNPTTGLNSRFEKTLLDGPKVIPGRLVEYANTIYLYPPGKITGKVTGITTGGTVVNVAEAVIVIKSRVSDGLWMPDVELTNVSTTTDSNGNYTFKSLIPGKYAVFMLGNDEFAALSQQDDASDDFNSVFKLISPGLSTVFNFQTVRKGSIQGNLINVVWDSVNGTFVAGPNTGVNVEIHGNRRHGETYLAGGAAPITNRNTFAWNYCVTHEPWNWQENTSNDVTTADSFSINTFLPGIVNNEPGNDITTEYNKVALKPHWFGKLPFTPIIVSGALPLLKDNAKFVLLPQYSSDGYAAPFPAGANDLGFADVNVKANATQTANLQLLNVSAFTNVRGRIMTSATTDFNPSGVPSGNSYVYGDFSGTEGYGALVVSGNDCYLTKWYSRTVNLPTSAAPSSWYDLRTNDSSYRYMAIPPLLGADTFTLKFQAYTALNVQSGVNYIGTVTALEKVKQGSGTAYSPASPISLALPMKLKMWNFSTNVTGNVIAQSPSTSGKFTFANRGQYRGWYEGSSASLTKADLIPGTTVTMDIINVPAAPTNYYDPSYLTVLPNDDWFPTDESYEFRYNVDHFEGNITLFRKGRTGKIYGRVVNANGDPILGAQVYLRASRERSDDYYISTFTSTGLNVCPTCPDLLGKGKNFQYLFDNQEFYPDDNSEGLWLKVVLPPNSPYDVNDDWGHGVPTYMGVTWQNDFVLNLKTAGGKNGF